jgi:hypothetical protein
MRIFGFEIKKDIGGADEDVAVSFVEPTNDEGAITIGNSLGGSYGISINMDGDAKSEGELVTKYRGMMLQPEISQAVDEVINEAINIDSHENAVEVVLDDTNLPDKVKDRIIEEFEEILRFLDFSNYGYDIFQKFYVDGRLNYHVIIDNENLKDGIKEVRYIDPRKLRLIKEMDEKQKDPHSGIPLKKVKKEYYLYSDSGFGSKAVSSNVSSGQTVQGYRIAKDSVARITSGYMNENNSLILSYLHPAIKPLNQLRMLEDATVIYTITRAPERRIFYIDVGQLPKAKAEQYLHDMMTRHKNKLQYDSDSGDITDGRKFMTMTEDFWFPRRGGERSTEVDILAGGNAAALSGDENLSYFQRKLYKSLKVPVSRLEPENMYSMGRVSEMTRDEIKFSKFIRRLRNRFSGLFDSLLEKQLILKGVLDPEEWDDIKNKVRYDFMKDNYFEELKQTEILREKITTLRDMEEQVGKYYSRQWITKNVLFMTDDEMREMQLQIDQERSAGLYNDPDDPGMDAEDDFDDSEQEPTDDEPVDDNTEIDAEESLKVINKTKSFKRKPQK